MRHSQGGAAVGSVLPQTKKHLKELVKSNPAAVWLYSTSMVAKEWGGPADQIPDDVEFLVVGPDPYHKRKWYAKVSRNAKGVVTVS